MTRQGRGEGADEGPAWCCLTLLALSHALGEGLGGYAASSFQVVWGNCVAVRSRCWMFLLSSRENNPETVHHRPEEASERLPAEVFFLAAVASSIGVMAISDRYGSPFLR